MSNVNERSEFNLEPANIKLNTEEFWLVNVYA